MNAPASNASYQMLSSSLSFFFAQLIINELRNFLREIAVHSNLCHSTGSCLDKLMQAGAHNSSRPENINLDFALRDVQDMRYLLVAHLFMLAQDERGTLMF